MSKIYELSRNDDIYNILMYPKMISVVFFGEINFYILLPWSLKSSSGLSPSLSSVLRVLFFPFISRETLKFSINCKR